MNTLLKCYTVTLLTWNCNSETNSSRTTLVIKHGRVVARRVSCEASDDEIETVSLIDDNTWIVERIICAT